MFKRSTKITSLLVAAASVVSMTPAMAVERIEAEEGTIYNAVAYKDGQFYVDGDVEDEGEGAYYYNNGKFNELDDIDSGDKISIYGDKYLNVDDGDYYIDLASGKVTDDDLADNDRDDAKSSLRKKLKKDNDGRYNNTVENTLSSLSKVEMPSFGDLYFEGDLLNANSSDLKVNHGAEKFHVYTDKDGKYIDADHNLGKITVKTTDCSAILKNTKDDDKNIRASITHKETIGQDADYIYRTAYLKIYEGTTTTSAVKFGGKGVTVNSPNDEILVIQKISKAQDSDDVDGAKFAKTVNTYFVTGEKGGDQKDLLSNFSIVNGKIINYEFDEKKETLEAKTITLKSNNGYYYTDFSDTMTEDEDVKDIDIDSEGNLWVLQKGYVKKYDNDEDLDSIYKVDGSMSQLSVYDKNNMIVWDEDDEVYSIIRSKNQEKEEEDTPVVTTGWNQAADGTWTYVNADGSKVTGWFQSPASGKWFYMDPSTGIMQTGWVKSPASGKWYYMNPSNGDMMTGWVQVGTTWYYLNPSNGDMQTGWINDGNAWYYCDASGAMLANTTVDGYVLGANGAWIR